MTRLRKYLFFGLLVLCPAVPLSAQLLSFGVKAGAQLTSSFDENPTLLAAQGPWQIDDSRFIIGPTAEIGIPLVGLRLEADALYHREGFNSTGQSVHANVWEFPIILKYRLPVPLIKPYAGIGYAPRLTGISSQSTNLSHGVVLSAGVSFGLLRIHVAPEIRYTRWNSSPIDQLGVSGLLFKSSQNQADVLVGVTF